MSRRGFILGAMVAAALSPAASADTITDWNNITLNVIRAVPLNPPVATRVMAMVHTAMFDAVNGTNRIYRPYLVTQTANPGASAEAAAAAAAHRVLTSLFPQMKGARDTDLVTSLAAIPDGLPKDRGITWGRFVAARVLTNRLSDKIDLFVPYTPSGLFGRWKPTPPAFAAALLPSFPEVRPWAMTSPDQFLPPGPPDFTSAEFATAYNEVKDLGEDESAFRTMDQTEIAYFWEDGGGSVTPPGHWLVIAQGVAADFGNDLYENARLFALLAITQADASVAVWDAKYFYDYVRPVTNIREEGDLDGNAGTTADPTWLSEIPTPPFPGYTSGHSGYSMGSAKILALFFGGDDYSFCGMSPDPLRWPLILPGVTRCWDSFSEAAEEGGQSRIYGGIHFQFDNVESLDLGAALGDYVFENFLTPLD